MRRRWRSARSGPLAHPRNASPTSRGRTMDGSSPGRSTRLVFYLRRESPEVAPRRFSSVSTRSGQLHVAHRGQGHCVRTRRSHRRDGRGPHRRLVPVGAHADDPRRDPRGRDGERQPSSIAPDRPTGTGPWPTAPPTSCSSGERRCSHVAAGGLRLDRRGNSPRTKAFSPRVIRRARRSNRVVCAAAPRRRERFHLGCR